MNAIFRPAILLMNRLRFAQKFLLIGALAILAVAWLVVELFAASLQQIGNARQELQGLDRLVLGLRAVQQMQQHRGLSSAVINGNAEMAERRAKKEEEVAAATAAFAAVLPGEIASGRTWQQMQADWQVLRKDGLELIAGANFRAHTELIARQLHTLAEVGDFYGLTRDADRVTSHLLDASINRLPFVSEGLGQLRAKGSGALSRKAIDELTKVQIGTILGQALGDYERFAKVNLAVITSDAATAERIKGPVATLALGVDEVGKMVSGDILLGSLATPVNEYFERTTRVIDGVFKLMHEQTIPLARARIDARLNELRRNLLVDLALTVSLLLLVGYFSIATYLSIARSVHSLEHASARIAQGDLTARASAETNDELRVVFDSVNGIAEAFAGVLLKIQGDAGQLLAAATRLAATAGTVALASEQQSEAASGMAAAVEEMTVSVDHISQNAQQAQNVTERSGDISAQGGRDVQAVVFEMEQIASSVNETSGRIGDLGRQSGRISAIVGVIREIADQTNLLALNAAIEAARAGEFGRGFAVVADEVRKLAERTAASTREIAAMVEAIRQGTDSAVASMATGVDRVNRGVELTRAAGQAMSQIAAGAQEVVGVVKDISLALREQNAASVELAQSVERIARMSADNNHSIAENAATADELHRLAESLQQGTARFRVA